MRSVSSSSAALQPWVGLGLLDAHYTSQQYNMSDMCEQVEAPIFLRSLVGDSPFSVV
jgi:hypothetical protein